MLSMLSHSPRALIVAALVAGATLALAPAAHAQSVSPERALLNSTPVAPSQMAVPVAQPVIDGERALMNHSASATPEFEKPRATWHDGSVSSIEGVRALLNRSSL